MTIRSRSPSPSSFVGEKRSRYASPINLQNKLKVPDVTHEEIFLVDSSLSVYDPDMGLLNKNPEAPETSSPQKLRSLEGVSAFLLEEESPQNKNDRHFFTHSIPATSSGCQQAEVIFQPSSLVQETTLVSSCQNTITKDIKNTEEYAIFIFREEQIKNTKKNTTKNSLIVPQNFLNMSEWVRLAKVDRNVMSAAKGKTLKDIRRPISLRSLISLFITYQMRNNCLKNFGEDDEASKDILFEENFLNALVAFKGVLEGCGYVVATQGRMREFGTEDIQKLRGKNKEIQNGIMECLKKLINNIKENKRQYTELTKSTFNS